MFSILGVGPNRKLGNLGNCHFFQNRILNFKSYLRYKIMFSENVIFHAQVKKFFTSLKSHIPISQHLMKFEICNAMMSISTERGFIYFVYL